MDDIHSCSYYCQRPACVLAQRDELRDGHGAGNQAPPPAQPAAQPVQRLSDDALNGMLRKMHELQNECNRQSLRSAIEAALQPQGWVLVPMEPYPSQRIAGTAEWMRQSAQDDDPDTDKTAAVYRAMIAARPGGAA